MHVDFNGTPVSANVAGDREHHFLLPRDQSTIPPKTLAALTAMQDAVDAAAKATTPKARQDAADNIRTAVGDLYDRAASTSRADREHRHEGYGYGAAKLARALDEVQTAVQLMADHAQQYDNPVGIGFRADRRDRSKAVMQLQLIADTLANLPAVADLD
ncbi:MULTISPECIES: hypothetical protein [Streptomyces]|uniref:Uncharacterized protein n=2 Tax=Streptomyces TaxID=1883 RepID=A0ABV9IQN7_9ACTN